MRKIIQYRGYTVVIMGDGDKYSAAGNKRGHSAQSGNRTTPEEAERAVKDAIDKTLGEEK